MGVASSKQKEEENIRVNFKKFTLLHISLFFFVRSFSFTASVYNEDIIYLSLGTYGDDKFNTAG